MREPKDYIVFPLDVKSFEEAEKYITCLHDQVGVFKVGLELFIRDGRRVIDRIHELDGAKIFLDLKLHDIPETVRRAMVGIAEMDILFTTVHCGESSKMLTHAVQGGNGKVRVLGVTLLTSVSEEEYNTYGVIGNGKVIAPVTVVMHRAQMAKEAGLAGVVCSPLEVEKIRAAFGKSFITMVPGIRPQFLTAVKEDQKRVATPEKAIRWGADYLVIGRPIRDAKDPLDAAKRIQEEIAGAL